MQSYRSKNGITGGKVLEFFSGHKWKQKQFCHKKHEGLSIPYLLPFFVKISRNFLLRGWWRTVTIEITWSKKRNTCNVENKLLRFMDTVSKKQMRPTVSKKWTKFFGFLEFFPFIRRFFWRWLNINSKDKLGLRRDNVFLEKLGSKKSSTTQKRSKTNEKKTDGNIHVSFYTATTKKSYTNKIGLKWDHHAKVFLPKKKTQFFSENDIINRILKLVCEKIQKSFHNLFLTESLFFYTSLRKSGKQNKYLIYQQSYWTLQKLNQKISNQN